MAFNPTATYHTVSDLHGNLFVVQGGVYYDKYGQSFPTIPASMEGYVAPTDNNTVGAITSGTVSGVAMTASTIDSSAIGGTTPAASRFTTVGASGQITSTLATGTAPLVVASTTNIPNLNASSLGGATFAAPGAIGGGTPAAANFTTIGATGQISSTLATGTAPLSVASTTNVANLNASSLSGATFAAPGPIGSTTPSSIVATSINSGQLAGFRNKVRNGNMNIAQRGTTYALTTALAYGSLDGWVANQAGTAAGIFNQSAGPANGGILNYAKLGRTAASAQLGAYLMQQALMTVDSVPLAGIPVTLSFTAYAGANFSGTALNANVYTSTGTDQASSTMQAWTGVANPATVAQAITTTPTRYSVTGTVAATTTQIGVSFGYTPVGTAGGDDNVYISNIQLEPGITATPYEIRSDAMEDQICRYHLRIFPAWVTATGSPITIVVSMRATPSVSANGAPAGFASTNTSAEAIIVSQTTPAIQTITATSEL